MIAAIALVVIGPEQLPSVMRALAKTIRELRAAANEVMRELDESLQDEPAPPKRSPESASTAAPQIESEAAPKSPSN